MPKIIQDKKDAENKDEQNKDAENTGGNVTDADNKDGVDPDKGDNVADGDNKDQDNDDEKDLGFPKDTPLVEMTSEQREAYYKNKGRKLEDANKEFKKILGDMTAADIASLKEVQGKYDALVASSSTGEQDHAEALKNAKEEGAREQRAKFAPVFLDAELKALLGERYDADRLTKILSKIKTDDFFKESGEVDSDSVKDYFDDMFELKAEQKKTQSKTPTKHGGGTPGDGTKTTLSGEELYAKYLGK
jgi:hypothetical protein